MREEVSHNGSEARIFLERDFCSYIANTYVNMGYVAYAYGEICVHVSERTRLPEKIHPVTLKCGQNGCVKERTRLSEKLHPVTCSKKRGVTYGSVCERELVSLRRQISLCMGRMGCDRRTIHGYVRASLILVLSPSDERAGGLAAVKDAVRVWADLIKSESSVRPYIDTGRERGEWVGG